MNKLLADIKNKRVTAKDVALHAGVSQTTVSLVLNDHPAAVIPQRTRDRVLNAARELHYRPRPAAQALKSGKTGIVGVWAARVKTPFHADWLGILQAEIRSLGLEMMINDTEPRVNWETHMRELAKWNVDGVIAFGCPEYVESYLELEGSHSLPLVGLDIHPDELGAYAARVPLVAMDHAAGARLAMEHLLARPGRLAYLTFEAQAPGAARHSPRLAAYEDLMRAAGRGMEIIQAEWTGPADAREAMARYLERHGPPAGLFCFCDTMAIGAHKAILEAGYSIPGDVALVGYDNVWMAEYAHPSLSSVGFDPAAAGRLACRLLQRRMAEPDAPAAVEWITPKLHVRASSGASREVVAR